MSYLRAMQEGSAVQTSRIELTPPEPYRIDEKQFENWQYRWNSKQAVIDQFLLELDRAMAQSEKEQGVTIRVVSE